MIAPNPNLLCQQAELYYYDFLCEEGRALIPEPMVSHIKQCQYCQEQIDKLEKALSQGEGHIEPEQEQVSSAVTVMLKLHFAYIGKPITCETVKPFLPGMLDPDLEIRIPTPITVHLDNCRQCSEDLETIRKLNLSRKQLRRLSQLLAEKPAEDNVSCSKARAAILAVVHMAFQETTKEVLKHLCTCLSCRKALYEFRDTICREYEEAEREEIDEKVFPCEELPITDIFDYVVPYGLDPAANQYVKFRDSLTSHMRTCPTCLAKMQHLHNTVYGIAERPESDVVTVCHIDESAKAEAATKFEDAYAGFPIRVEIASREEQVKAEQLVSTVSFTTALRQKVSAVNLKRFAKTGVAAAAVILIAIALLLTIQPTKAVTIDQIYKALEKAKNVYIASFVPDKKEPVQEIWVSRSLNVYITKTGNQLVLWDISNRVRKSKQLDITATETMPLTANMITDIEKLISGSLGLMPFYDMSEIPGDAQWSRVDEKGVEEPTKGIEVYVLQWLEKRYDGSIILRKWQLFVDANMSLPQRVEWYKKLINDSEFRLETKMVVKYLKESELQTVIKELSF